MFAESKIGSLVTTIAIVALTLWLVASRESVFNWHVLVLAVGSVYSCACTAEKFRGEVEPAPRVETI